MVLLVSFLIGIQVLHSVAASAPTHFLTPSCNDLMVWSVAENVLEMINFRRWEGYSLRLQRIFDVHELPQTPGSSIFYLILDVLETDCHVRRRKFSKECKIRDAHETVYGQCKVAVYFNKEFKLPHLYNYDCVLHPISKFVDIKICPDCPNVGDSYVAHYQKTATDSLAKFNADTNHTHYFGIIILNVTRASQQVQEKQTPQSTSAPGQAEPHDDGESHRDQLHRRHRRPHHYKHHGHKHERQGPHLHNSTAADIIQSFADQNETVSLVRVVSPRLNSHVSLPSLPEVQAEQLDGKPDSTEVQEPMPEMSSHHIRIPVPISPPFPRGFSQTSECPGESAVTIPGLELPIKVVKP